MKSKSDKSILISVLTFGLIAILVVFSMTLAWLTLGNTASSSLDVTTKEGLDLRYMLYWYQDENFDGATVEDQITLKDNVKSPETAGSFFYIEAKDRVNIPSLTSNIHDRAVAPGDRLSFALKLWNQSANPVDIEMEFNGVKSFINTDGDVPDYNKIQNAYQYLVTRLAYVDDENNEDDSEEKFEEVIITKDSDKKYLSTEETIYTILSNLHLGAFGSDQAVVVIFFDLYFDPTVDSYILDSENNKIPNNSNGFMNQSLDVERIVISRLKK